MLNMYFSVFNHFKDVLADERQMGTNGLSGTYIAGYLDDEALKKVKYPSDFLTGVANTRDHIGMPIITFEEGRTSRSGLELGSTNRQETQTYLITIYGEDDMQTMRLGEYVVSGADQIIDYYDYESDYDNPAQIGTLKVRPEDIQGFFIRNLKPDQSVPIERPLKHRYEVAFTVTTK